MSKISFSKDNILTINDDTKSGEAKKHWYTKLDICPSPTCSCKDVTIELYDTENKNATSPEHRVSFDVFEQKPVRMAGQNKTSIEDFRLAESLADNFSKKIWHQLRSLFVEYKRELMKTTPIDQLHISFPEKKIERDGLMVGYFDIFPYAEELLLELNDIKYLLDDQYCLSSTCSCTHTILTIVAIRNEKKTIKRNNLVIRLDYKSNSLEIMQRGPKNIAKPDELVREIIRNGFVKIFKERHRRLREIYNYFRKKSFKNASLSITNNGTKKIGRNDPCPCGSGKKYKKCCM